MSGIGVGQAKKDLSDAIADHLMKTREDAMPASDEIADAIYELIDNPVVGHRFSISAVSELRGTCVGVAICGRPVSRRTEAGRVVEVTRLCTDGTKNACSFLYSAAARAAKSLGYAMIQTFILETETGISLKATGWEMGHTTKAETWNRPSRGGRREDQPNCRKVKWFKVLTPAQRDSKP